MRPSHGHSVALYPDTFRALTRAAYRPAAGPIEEAMADRVARALALLDEHERAEEARGERYVIAEGTVPELPAMHPPVEHKTRVPAWKGREVERGERPADTVTWPWVGQHECVFPVAPDGGKGQCACGAWR